MFSRMVAILSMAILLSYSNVCLMGSKGDDKKEDKKDKETRQVKKEVTWGYIKGLFAGGSKDEG